VPEAPVTVIDFIWPLASKYSAPWFSSPSASVPWMAWLRESRAVTWRSV
jgi:hypothetical protein